MPRVRRVNGRALIGMGVGVLLPLPLVLLLGTLLRPSLSSDARVSPMLDTEQRMRLATYGRTCESSSACEPPLGCLYELRHGKAYCTDSQCLTDAQCPEGEVCRAFATGEQGPLVRICAPLGVRQEGEGCFKVPVDQQSACASGLLCGGKDNWCARPCRLDTPTECPDGFFCADTTPQPVCLPTCEKRGCPSGEQCIRFGEGASQCASVYGTSCQQVPCPEGQRCTVRTDPPQPGKVWMRCVAECGENHPPCPTGMICDDWQCIPGCDPQGPAICAEGFRCRQAWPDAPFACHPDWSPIP
ncbi:Cys-rich repeat-containing protein [Stigmatella aurantiaca]|uniref:Cys-rich repeat-containing protein n=1 Tax=Stigmatella aurantiaca TaxID=41 RepID=A0A1H8CVL3_STIAU|nr:Cys-rich repeat-containing protein [Stigmatella aurantiaca]